MRIKTRLLASVGGVIISIIVFSFVTIFVIKQMYGERQTRDVTFSLIQETLELEVLTNEFIQYNDNKTFEEWERVYELVNLKLDSLQINDPIETILLNNIKISHDDISDIFLQIINIRNNTKSLDENYGDPKTIEKELINKVEAKMRNIVKTMFRFDQVARNKLDQAESTGYIMTIIFISLLLSITSVLAAYVYTAVTRLDNITHIATQISKGRFNSKISAKVRNNPDEIGDLAKAFTKMNKVLQEEPKKLEKEVKKRTNALDQKVEQLKKSEKKMGQMLIDIEAEKGKYKQQVLETEKFKQAVEDSADGIIMTTPDTSIIYVNQAWEELYGYKMNEVVGKKLGLLQSNKTPKKVYEKMWKKLLSKKPFITEEIVDKDKKGQEFNIQLVISPLTRDGETLFYVGLVQDITQRKEVEKAKTEFVSLASHQFRTPLSSINWFAKSVLDEETGKLNDEQKSCMEAIYESNQRLIELTKSLLNISRLELGTFVIKPKETDILKITENVIKELGPRSKKNKIVIKEEYEKNIPHINADPKILDMIVQNLLSNAIKYSPENSRVSLNISLKKANEKFMDKQISEDHILIQVTDNGYGIPKSQQDKVFDKLFRADNVKELDTEGTGLGLYIVKSMVEHSCGQIWFESEEGKGTTFYVILPLKCNNPNIEKTSNT